MPTLRLTPRGVAALTTDEVQTEYWDDVVPGLALRIGRGGTKTYLVRYRAGGKHRRLTIGKHPNLTLADARERAREKLGMAQAGEDPAEERRLARSGEASFSVLVTEVVAAKAVRNSRGVPDSPRTKRERQRVIDTHLLPVWGSRPAASITRRDVVQLVDRIAARGAPVEANRTLRVISSIFNTGLEKDFPTLEANPAHRVREPGAESKRERFLERDEIVAVWQACEWEAPVTRALFRFALLTSQRIANVRALRWADIDESDVWRIPADAFKGRRPHLVPLSAQALAVLAELRPLTGEDEYVFPGRGDGKRPHVNSTNSALERIRKRSNLEPWTIHDFRTTFRTHATRAKRPTDKRDPAGLGVAPNVADAVLGHKEASLGFNRYQGEPDRYLLAEKRAALKAWGAFVKAAVK